MVLQNSSYVETVYEKCTVMIRKVMQYLLYIQLIVFELHITLVCTFRRMPHNFTRCWSYDKSINAITLILHTHPFNGPLSGTTRVSWYQKGKTNLDFTEARDSEWQWHQLAICKSTPRSRQITTPAPHHSVFTGRMPFLPPNQQRQSTEGNILKVIILKVKINSKHY